MRAISQYRNYEGITAQAEDKMVLANGSEQILTKGLSAAPFRWMDVSTWEREEALKAWPKMRGLAEDDNPFERLSCFDSFYAQQVNGWTDEERIKVEEALRTGPGLGPDYIIVEAVKAPEPWPAYPKLVVQGRRTIDLVVEKIIATVTDLELDPVMVGLYERENLNRPEVLAALEALSLPVAEEEVILA